MDNYNKSMLTIGEVAQSTGLKNGTIRFYERRGIIEKPSRAKSGYRLYSSDVINRINFIKNAQSLGFTLNEIKNLLVL